MDTDTDVQEQKPRGLGRGLNALFEDDDNSFARELERAVSEQEEQGVRKRQMVGVEQLHPGPYQPRRNFVKENLETLADSIRQYGILQPLLVRADDGDPNKFSIVAGERRWRAAQIAQLHEVPVILLEISELEAFKIALIENLQREDLDPMEEAYGYQHLLEEFNQTQDDLAKAVGKSRPHITNMIRLISLPDTVQGYISKGELSAGHGRALVNAPDAETLAQQIIQKGLNVRQTEKLVSEVKNSPIKTRAKGAKQSVVKDADTLSLERDMSNALGMKVSIESADGRSGKLVIDFKSLDQLDEVLHRLAHYPGSRLSG